jgi:drug/metabolite transporter (DMT)-like permease
MQRYSILFVLVVVQCIFGLWPVLVKTSLELGDKATVLSMYRDLLASCILWTCVWVECGYPTLATWTRSVTKYKNELYSVDMFRKYSIFLLLGLASCVNSLGFVLSLDYITPFNSALLHPSIPVFAFLMGFYLEVEEYSNKKMMGACICIIGALLVVLSQADLKLSSSLLGNGFLVAQSLGMACLLVGQKFVADDFSSLRVTAMYYSVGTLFSIPACLIMAFLNGDGITLKHNFSLLVIAFGAVFVVCVNYAALTWATRHASPAISSSSMMLQPPITFIVSYLSGYKESLGLWDGIGGIFIVAGLIQTVFAESDNDDYTPLFGDVRRKSLDETYADSFSSYSDDEMELMIKANSFTGVSNGSVAFQI